MGGQVACGLDAACCGQNGAVLDPLPNPVDPAATLSRRALKEHRSKILFKELCHKPCLNPGGVGFEESLTRQVTAGLPPGSQLSDPHPMELNEGTPRDRQTSAGSDSSNDSDEELNFTRQESVGSSSVCSVVSGCTTADNFRGSKRHGVRRLMITHTMGQCPSAALRLVIENGDDIHKLYDLQEGMLGKGSFGVVKKAVLKSSGATRAAKIMDKGAMSKQIHLLKKEIEVMKLLDHPSLLMLYEIFEDETKLYLVLQLCAGGHLKGYVKKAGKLTEMQAGVMNNQVFRAVCYLHTHRICHRDLKAENCLLESKGRIELCNLKVADFGLSRMLELNESFKGIAGTLNHMAPEVLVGKYGLPCDLWSCGVIAFFLLSGCLPFVAATEEGLKSKILHSHVQFVTKEWVDAHQPAMDFIGQLLERNVKKRFSAEEALVHAWMKAVVPKPVEVKLKRQTLSKVVKFRSLSKLVRAVLHVMVSMLPDNETKTAREFFVTVDINGDGMISMEELREALGVDAKQLQVGDQSDLSYTEFLAALMDVKKHLGSPVFKATFSSFDKNGDGSLSISELASGKLLGALSTTELIDEMEKVDLDSDFSLDFHEFKQMMENM